jgi:hypothetical protein
LRIECGTAKAKLTGLEDALPQIDDPKAKTICTLRGEALSSILRVSACAAGDTALHLNGVFVDVSAGKITTWTADGVRAAACERPSKEDACSLLPWPLFLAAALCLENCCPESPARASSSPPGMARAVTIFAEESTRTPTRTWRRSRRTFSTKSHQGHGRRAEPGVRQVEARLASLSTPKTSSRA